MRQRKISEACSSACAAALLAVAGLLGGCGMPGAPLPPSLNLPDRVVDLSAVRTGDQVALSWTMPARTTDKVALSGPIFVRICRNTTASTSCNAIASLQLPPGSAGAYSDALPATLATNPPRPIQYFVELPNRRGRSAGLSNRAVILAGAAPPAVAGLSAELRKDGVLLHWAPVPPDSAPVAVRLERRLLSPPANKPVQDSQEDLLGAPPEPAMRTLLLDPGSPGDRALDIDIRFGRSYEYRAQRVERVDLTGETLELASPLSEPIHIDAQDIFPPSVPRDLAAVATMGDNGNSSASASPAIDLSWLPNSDLDLAGYIVYRRDISSDSANTGTLQRISPQQPVVGPAFHDGNVQSGHSYAYSVSAIGQNGHESARSREAQETVPAQ